MRARLALALAALLASAAAQTPTAAQLNAQRNAELGRQQQAARQQQQQAEQRRIATRRLPVPCVVPDSYYPLRTCRVSPAPNECARGYNAWPTFADCCAARTGAHLAGCTDLSAPTPTCFIPASFYPDRACAPTTNLTRCSYNWGTYGSEQVSSAASLSCQSKQKTS
jgi:hypothetical protein